MTTRVQTFRTPTSGVAPAAGTRLAGELWLNLADFQLGFIDASRNAQKLVAVRYFQTTANYAAGEMVVQAGAIYAANGAVTAGAFNGTQWTKIATAADLAAGYLPLAGGTLTGPLTLSGNPTLAPQAANKAYVDSQVAAAPFLPLAGGTLSGLLTLSGAPTVPLHAATKAYVDSGAPPASSTAPLMDGTAAAGVAAAWSRGDHVHPTDTTRAAQASLAGYAPLAGATFTGPVSATTVTASGSVAAATGVYFNSPTNDFFAQQSGSIRALALRAGVYALQFDNSVGQWNYIGNSLLIETLDVVGNLTIAGNGLKPGGGAWAASSDARIKTVEGEWTAGLEEIVKLNPVSYSYKGNDTPTEHSTPEILVDGEVKRAEHKSGAAPYPASPHYQVATAGRKFVGLVAQEVEATGLAGMVVKRNGFIDGVAVDDLRDLDTTPLVFALVNAIKQLNAKVVALEAQR